MKRKFSTLINIKINFTNRWFYTFIVIGALMIISVGVYAIAGTIPNPGHSLLELQPCSDGQILQMSGADWTCVDMAEEIPTDDVVLKTKTVEIGSWNMDTTRYINVNHDIILSRIRGISAIIINDAGLGYYDFGSTGSDRMFGTSTDISLVRTTGGYFDNANFDGLDAASLEDLGMNRGWVIITYEQVD
ncbi:hypothetical protein KAS08_03540 [Candidatus Pacearchaeota archaeon]|nr:hypothetical protein [Candidatus Pacearchaeota archaeon]